MTKEEFVSLSAVGEHWIPVSEAYAQNFKPIAYLLKNRLSNNKYAVDVVHRLYDLFRSNDILNAYEISGKDLQHVINVFVRTNSGGKLLTKGDLQRR